MNAPRLLTEPAPNWNRIGRHDIFPDVPHDDAARFNFLANMVKYVSGDMLGGNMLAYEKRARPSYQARQGRPPENRSEVREAMVGDPHYQFWSALRRNTMEMRQQAGRLTVLAQAEDLAERAEALSAGTETLILDPDLEIPAYVRAVDNHCMPGSYYTELVPGDVTPAANYDAGLFITAQGLFGRYSDGAGKGVAAWLNDHMPEGGVRRILDIGCGLAHNTVPVAQAFPDAEVIGVDVAAPMLRYGHARAQSMGAPNLVLMQRNGEDLSCFEDGSFDFVFTTIFLHETSWKALNNIMAETHRLLRPGGLSIHAEQPPYHGMDDFEQFLRDWDAYYNNEPFWTRMHTLDMRAVMEKAGFAGEDYFETTIIAVVDDDFPQAAGKREDYGRGAIWHTYGVRKPAAGGTREQAA